MGCVQFVIYTHDVSDYIRVIGETMHVNGCLGNTLFMVTERGKQTHYIYIYTYKIETYVTNSSLNRQNAISLVWFDSRLQERVR